MLNIKKFTCNMLQENCYVVSDETKECMIVDCGAFYPEERQAIVDYIRTNNLKPMHLWLLMDISTTTLATTPYTRSLD